MNLIPLRKDARPVSLDELFCEARTFGLVGVHTTDKGKYWAKIVFATITNTKLEADSPLVDTPHEALQIAIVAAKKVREQFK